MGKSRGIVGESHLKKYTRGSLATTTPITLQEFQIYLLFNKGVTLKKISLSLQKSNIIIDDQALFDILRKVGMHFQALYRKHVNQPHSIPQLIFANFVKGESIASLCDTNRLDPKQLFEIIRKIGLLYASYCQKNGKYHLN